MANSISTTSNTPTATNSTPATFKAGDAVLWAAVSLDTYKLQASSDQHSKRLVIHHANIEYSFDADGRSSPDDALPSLFHDTPANRQAINTLYGNADPLAASQHTPCTAQTSLRPTQKVIDTTTHDDKEIIVLPCMTLVNIAFDIEYAAQALNDISQTLALIHYEKVSSVTGRSLARLAHSSADTWEDLLQSTLDEIRTTLATTGNSEVTTHA